MTQNEATENKNWKKKGIRGKKMKNVFPKRRNWEKGHVWGCKNQKKKAIKKGQEFKGRAQKETPADQKTKRPKSTGEPKKNFPF